MEERKRMYTNLQRDDAEVLLRGRVDDSEGLAKHQGALFVGEARLEDHRVRNVELLRERFQLFLVLHVLCHARIPPSCDDELRAGKVRG